MRSQPLGDHCDRALEIGFLQPQGRPHTIVQRKANRVNLQCIDPRPRHSQIGQQMDRLIEQTPKVDPEANADMITSRADVTHTIQRTITSWLARA